MKKAAVILLFFVSHQLMANGWIFKAGNTFGYNPQEITLWDYQVEDGISKGIYVGFGYEFSLFKNVSLAIIPSYEQHQAKVTINNIKAEGYAYNMSLPFQLAYAPGDKWEFLSGITIQNYMEFHDFALNKSHNFRYNFDLGVRYHFTQVWSIELSHSLILGDKVDALLLKNYANHISLGLHLNLSHVFKKKK